MRQKESPFKTLLSHLKEQADQFRVILGLIPHTDSSTQNTCAAK